MVLTVLIKQKISWPKWTVYQKVQTRCEVTSNQLDQQVTPVPDTIITSDYEENIQDFTLNLKNDLDTEQRHEEGLTQRLALTFQLAPEIMKT